MSSVILRVLPRRLSVKNCYLNEYHSEVDYVLSAFEWNPPLTLALALVTFFKNKAGFVFKCILCRIFFVVCLDLLPTGMSLTCLTYALGWKNHILLNIFQSIK